MRLIKGDCGEKIKEIDSSSVDLTVMLECDGECSECGESIEFTPGFMPNYCPNCGAKVVE